MEAFGALLHPSIDFTSLLLPFSSPALPLKCGTQSVTSDNCTTNEESEAIKSLLQNAPVGCSVIAWRRLQRALPMPAIFTDRSHCEDPTSQNLSFEGFHFVRLWVPTILHFRFSIPLAYLALLFPLNGIVLLNKYVTPVQYRLLLFVASKAAENPHFRAFY